AAGERLALATQRAEEAKVELKESRVADGCQRFSIRRPRPSARGVAPSPWKCRSPKHFLKRTARREASARHNRRGRQISAARLFAGRRCRITCSNEPRRVGRPL